MAPGTEAEGGGSGAVKPEHRGGFLDLWEAANALEHSSHPYEGTIWDRDGNPITFKDEYRVDFITDRAEKFLRQKQETPFLLLFLRTCAAFPATGTSSCPTTTARAKASMHP